MRAGSHVWTRLEKESDGKTGIGLSPDGTVEHDAMAASSFAASPRAMVGAVLGLFVICWPAGGKGASTMSTILLTAPYLIPFLERFRPVFEYYGLEVIVPLVQERMEEADLLGYAGKFDGVLCGDDRYTERVLIACAPRLKVISKWGTDIDSIDAVAAERMGIMVGRTLNAFTLPVADTVLGYMLAFARRGPWMDREMKAGKWEKIPGVSLSECTLGVVGVGNIGKAVLRRARTFGMRLLGNDIIPIAPDFLAENHVQMVTLKELVAEADFISLTTDLNAISYHLVNAHCDGRQRPCGTTRCR